MQKTYPSSIALTALSVLLACTGDDSATTVDSATGTTEGTSATTTAGTTQGTTQGTTAATTMATGSASMTSTTTDATTAGTTTETTGPITATDPTATTSTTDPTTSTTDPTTSTTDTTTDASTTGDVPCMMGTIICEGDTAKTCDGMGGYSDEELCESVCVDGVGCLLCSPGSTQCDGQVVETCNEQGDAWIPGDTCDAVQGLSCDPDAGNCVGACAGLGLSYVGCDYYPTVLQQHDGYNTAPGNVFSIAVANTTNQVAAITVTQGANNVAQFNVPANSVVVQDLPWVNALTKGQGPTVMVADGAYRVRSTVPVTIYQFNPLKSTTTNDASLLLPVNTWRDEYIVAAWPTWLSSYPGFYAVVARQDNTTVTLTPSATGKQIQAGAGVAANGTGVVVLNEGDVLQVMSNGTGDVTGTRVSADKPVQVFGGHECTNVPLNITACDHLEESMFPIDTLAKDYIVVPPVQVPNDTLDKAQVVRVIATEDATTLTFDPDQPVNKNLAKAGDFLEMSLTTASFKISSDKKIMVSQYMVGQSANFGTSDPSMLLAVPIEQYRTNYLFYAAPSWTANYVDVIGPTGVKATVDGGMVNGWKPIGNSGFSVAHVKIANNLGTHTVTGDQKVGISVYGVQSSGSYWFPGGLDLDILPQ